MKRIRLDYDSFRILVLNGKYSEQGVTIKLDEFRETGNFDLMLAGQEVEQFGAKMILADIGFPLINAILDLEKK